MRELTYPMGAFERLLKGQIQIGAKIVRIYTQV
jgi:hypothetical protein